MSDKAQYQALGAHAQAHAEPEREALRILLADEICDRDAFIANVLNGVAPEAAWQADAHALEAPHDSATQAQLARTLAHAKAQRAVVDAATTWHNAATEMDLARAAAALFLRVRDLSALESEVRR